MQDDERYIVCKICGNSISEYDVQIVDIGCELIDVCERCLIENSEFKQCDYCLQWFHVDELIYFDEKDEYYCINCYEEKFNNIKIKDEVD